jgi:hypothetical protein
MVLCPPGSDLPALCISVLRLPDDRAKSPRDALASSSYGRAGRIEILENEKALLTHSILSDGGATESCLWHLAVRLIPKGVLLVLLSYSFEVSLREHPDTLRDRAILTEEVRGRIVSLDLTDYFKSLNTDDTEPG